MFAIPLGSKRVETAYARYSPQLVRYVRTEYGDESPEWLISEAQSSRRNSSISRSKRTAIWRRRVVQQGLSSTS